MKPEEKHKIEVETLKYINKSMELQSLLYDLDLLPEQLKQPSFQWNQMLILSNWHKGKCLRDDAEKAKTTPSMPPKV